ncbi:MAG: formylmethanofuran dehydrogenase subunit A [Candidatus Lokiarchaeota archaeon]|nr:formylmethanofuran dehydrogenase subunit A [Candidatus Lokiarchaeota archaeon]
MGSNLLIKSGLVFDPRNKLAGEKMDIGIKDGKVVDPKEVPKDATVIDASGKIIMPGGVDIHSHIAGPKVNVGRLFRPEDHVKDPVTRTSVTRSGSGYSVPSTFVTGYRYAQMGYTTVVEPAMPPIMARHTHEGFHDIPIIDKACFPLFDNNWFVMEFIKNGDMDSLAAYVTWLLKTTKGYAVKIVNPGGAEMWAWGKSEFGHLDDKVLHFDVSPRDIITSLCKVNEQLKLPHTIHVHGNNLGHPGNYEIMKETFECVKGIEPRDGRKPVMHVTHCQFNSYAGTDAVTWKDFASGAEPIAEYLNSHDHVTIDVGQVILGENTTTMTADSPWEHALYQLGGTAAWGVKPGVKWVNGHAETESGTGIVPYIFDPKVNVNAIQWAIGLELFLMIEDPFKVFLTTDHPNGGPFTRYPEVIALLMDKKHRDAALASVAKGATEKTKLKDLSREYTLSDIATITRAGTSKSLGMLDKGHLGIGAEGSVSIYDLKKEGNVANDIIKAFRNAWCTIKEGQVVAKGGQVVTSVPGSTIWTDVTRPVDKYKELVEQVKREWIGRYTVSYNNYPVFDSYVPRQKVVKIA